MFTFLHAADLHLDSAFRAVGTLPEALAARLREASLEAWDHLVDLALERRVAFVVLAGDLYDGAERGLRAQRRFLQGLRRLSDAGIRSFVAYGNHDPLDEGWSAIDSFPEGVVIFPAATEGASASTTHFTVGDATVSVSGISYATRATTENLVKRFAPASGPGLHVAVLHANVGGSGEHANYSPCSLADLRATGHQYWALGHIHKRTVLDAPHPWVVYPGDLQGRSPKPSEAEPKGALLVSATADQVTDAEFVALDLVRFVEVAVDIADRDLVSLIEALEAAADPAAHGDRSLIVRAEVHGRGELHRVLLDPARRAEVLETLRERPGTDPFVWWDRIHWSTRPTYDYRQLRRGGDFVADLLATADGTTRVGDEAAGPRLPGELARLVERARRDLDDAAPATELAAEAELRERAARLAVDLVMDDGS